MNLVFLPVICGARHPVTKEPIAIKRGDVGFYPWSAMRTDTHTPESFNEAHGITPEQVRAMMAGAMFGWRGTAPAVVDINRKD